MVPEPPSKRRKLSATKQDGLSLPGFTKWNLEQDYERRKDKKKNESNRLLVKSPESGKWGQNAIKAGETEDDQESSEGSDAASPKTSGVYSDGNSKPTPRRPKLPPKEEIRQAKEELAQVASLINESPEEHIALLSTLAQLAVSESPTVKQLALGTQLAVYKDIIPGYRIRPLSKEESQSKLSKDVRNLRTFEQTLLRGYQSYVQSLASLSKKDDAAVASVAISCACNLLTSVPHFNSRNELITILVEKLSARTSSTDSAKCRQALAQLFRDDEEGNASLEAVSQLTKMITSKNYHIHEDVLNTFLHLRLLSEFVHKASTNHINKDDPSDDKPAKKVKQKKEFRTKRERKLMKERKVDEKELQEADAVVSYEEREKNQAEMLKLVFVAYFRILKARTPHLMGAVLEGLAKYAHLINQDFFGDVLEALRDLIGDASNAFEDDGDADEDQTDSRSNRNVTRESLLCIITAFALLQGQQDVAKSANSLHLDLNFFTSHLYRTLFPLSMDQDIELSARPRHAADAEDADAAITKTNEVNVATTTVLLLRSLQATLLPSTATKLTSPVRIGAFTKQLLTASLNLPQKSAEAVLALLQQVTKVHGNKVAALWSTEERKGDGVFNASSAEFESSNPFAATIWEGEILRLYFDPKVRESVKGIERNILDVR